MTIPTITDYPGDIPAKGQSNTVFDTNVDAYLVWLSTLNIPELKILTPWISGIRDEVAATAMSGTLPSIAGKATNFVRVNAGETAMEFRTPAEVIVDLGVGQQATAIWEAGTGTTDGTVSPAKVSAAIAALGFAGPTYATEVGTTSGSAFDFTGIPAGVKEITLSLAGVSSASSVDFLVQLGTSGGVVETGYAASSARFVSTAVQEVSSTIGMNLRSANSSYLLSGAMTFTRTTASGNVWVQKSTTGGPNATITGGGHIDLGAEVTQLRFRTASGDFDAGTANISWS